MVQAILDGRNTMTRRIVKPQPDDSGLWNDDTHPRSINSTLSGWNGTVNETGESKEFKCPYGQPGDILWVRETFYAYGRWVKNGISKTGKQKFKFQDLTGTDFQYKYFNEKPDRIKKGKLDGIGWYKRPSIFMPHKAARIFLEVVSVRVERLKDISEADAIGEGVGHGFQMNAGWPDYMHIKNGICTLTQDTAEMSFASLWESINGNGSWDANPWVWCISFKRIK